MTNDDRTKLLAQTADQLRNFRRALNSYTKLLVAISSLVRDAAASEVNSIDSNLLLELTNKHYYELVEILKDVVERKE